MKITVLTHLESESTSEYDAVVPQVVKALQQAGHKAAAFGVHADLKQLIGGLQRRKPDLVFNLMESFGDSQFGAVGVAGVLDLLQLPYTGGGPGELYLQEDKSLTKKLLSYEQLLYPDFAVFSKDADLETGGNLRMPFFVKPLRMEASIGVDGKSLVRNAREMMERVVAIHEQVNDSALAEEFIDGREFYVGVLGNREPVAFPPIEMDFSGLAEGAPRVLDSKAKWDENSDEYKGTKAVLAQIDDELKAKLQKVAIDAYRALRVRDYGRIDLRLTDAGEIYVIEVNASCYLEQSSEFVIAAAAMDIDYPGLINRIVELAIDRHKSGTVEIKESKRRKGKSSAKADKQDVSAATAAG
jgi:D-alanine-D-alanine ligase